MEGTLCVTTLSQHKKALQILVVSDLFKSRLTVFHMCTVHVPWTAQLLQLFFAFCFNFLCGSLIVNVL